MQQTPWFERTFDFSSQQNTFPSILERLEGTPLRLKAKVQPLSGDMLVHKPDSTWSIQENIGHLSDLEVLWQGRLEDILGGAKYLRPTDLENRQTDAARHNERSVADLLDRFQRARDTTMHMLTALTEREIQKAALHPRLEQPMRITDLFIFVADHDDHHLARITHLIQATR